MLKHQHLIIDKITNSIEEILTGKKYDTDVDLITIQEVNRVHKKDGWHFDWKAEFEYFYRYA